MNNESKISSQNKKVNFVYGMIMLSMLMIIFISRFLICYEDY